MNLKARLKKLESRIKDNIVYRVITFSDGEVVQVPDRKIGDMFSSAMRGNPDKLAQLFYRKLDAGFEDEAGLVHLLDVYRVDFSTLWDDEDYEDH